MTGFRERIIFFPFILMAAICASAMANEKAIVAPPAAMKMLESDQHFPLAQQQDLLDSFATGVDKIINDSGNDPQLLIDRGQILARQGVDPQTGIMEYWGSSDIDRQRMSNWATAAIKFYDRAFTLATASATDLANHISSPNDPNADLWQKANDMAGAAQYQEARMQCALVLAMEPGNTQRRALIDEAAKTLSHWDNADSGIQPQVRFLLAKLQVLRKPDDIAGAKTSLDMLIENPDNKISPAPSPQLIFEAMCYRVVAELGAGDLQGAQTALASARADQQAHFARDRVQAATLRLLEYRILAMKADNAPAGPDQAAANAAVVTALGQLIADFPGLRDVIDQQLSARLPADASLTQLDPLLLNALVDQGRQEVLAAGNGSQADRQIVARALNAANEILSRFHAGAVSADQAVEASLVLGIFQEYLGDKIDAAGSLLDHAARFANVPSANANFALDRARLLIGDLQQSDPNNPNLAKLQNRFLPLAVNPPFNRHEFALQYAASLFNQGNWDQAIKYYRLAQDTDDQSRLLGARYGEMMSLKNELENSPTLSAAQQQQIASSIQKLAENVASAAETVLQHSTSADEKTRARATLARTLLLAADMSRRDPADPARILKLLEGFENLVQDLPESKSMLAGALFLRVQAYVDLGREDDATHTLVQYLNSTTGSEGAQTVHDLLAKLNDDLDKAKAQSDMAKVRQLAADRAALSGFLVKWAQTSDDPKIHGYIYIYARFDADSKRLAATLQTDPGTRRRDLLATLELYRQLQSPENVALYQATLDPANQADKDYPDPLVSLGIGLIAFDLGDCQLVKSSLGPLIQDEKLGENNDQCWEATFKLLDCMHALAQKGDANTTDAQVQQSLKILYLIWRDGTGGAKWHSQFEALRRQVLPAWSPPPAQVSQ